MQTFKISETYGAYCNECGKIIPAKPSNSLTINGVQYTLCDDCFRLFIGELYKAKTPIFEQLIATLAQHDRQKILSIINKNV